MLKPTKKHHRAAPKRLHCNVTLTNPNPNDTIFAHSRAGRPTECLLLPLSDQEKKNNGPGPTEYRDENRHAAKLGHGSLRLQHRHIKSIPYLSFPSYDNSFRLGSSNSGQTLPEMDRNSRPLPTTIHLTEGNVHCISLQNTYEAQSLPPEITAYACALQILH